MVVKTRGSITVEAAFIIPIVICTIFFIIYLTFYLHDICQIKGTINHMHHKVSMLLKHKTNINADEIIYDEINTEDLFYWTSNNNIKQADLISAMEVELGNRLFILKVEQIEILRLPKIEIKVRTRFIMSMFGISSLFHRLESRTIERIDNIHYPSDFVRKYQIVKDTGKKIKGINELVNQFNKVWKP